MHNRARTLLGFVGGLALVAAATIAIGRASFERRIAGETEALLASGNNGGV